MRYILRVRVRRGLYYVAFGLNHQRFFTRFFSTREDANKEAYRLHKAFGVNVSYIS